MNEAAAKYLAHIWADSHAEHRELEQAAALALPNPPEGFEHVSTPKWHWSDGALWRLWEIPLPANNSVSVTDNVNTQGEINRSTVALTIIGHEQIDSVEECDDYQATVELAFRTFRGLRGL